MGSFTKKYIRSFHPEDSLHLTWDIGYKNVAIYDGKRLVKQFEQAGQFTKGVSFQDEKLGKIRIEFTATKPLLLELKVNEKKYKPTKKGKQEVDLSGVVALFWVLMTLNGIAIIFNVAVSLNSGFVVLSIEDLGYLALSMCIYFTSAFLLGRKKYWAFFIGFAFFMLTTALYSFAALLFSLDLIEGIVILARLLMLTYLIMSIPKVNFAIKKFGKRKDDTIIDGEL